MVSWAASEMQGWRIDHEDTYIVHEISLTCGRKAMLYGVFDGHAGK